MVCLLPKFQRGKTPEVQAWRKLHGAEAFKKLVNRFRRVGARRVSYIRKVLSSNIYERHEQLSTVQRPSHFSLETLVIVPYDALKEELKEKSNKVRI